MIKENREKLTNPSVANSYHEFPPLVFFLTKFHARNVFNEISRFFPPSCSTLSPETGWTRRIFGRNGITIPARTFPDRWGTCQRWRRRCNSEMRFSTRFAFHLLSIFSPSPLFLNPDDFHISLDLSRGSNYRIPIWISLPYDFFFFFTPFCNYLISRTVTARVAWN